MPVGEALIVDVTVLVVMRTAGWLNETTVVAVFPAALLKTRIAVMLVPEDASVPERE